MSCKKCGHAGCRIKSTVYVGATPAWERKDGEQCYQVYFDYIANCGHVYSNNFEFMTSNGSPEVRAI